jgi:hypothetical protein
MSISGVLFLGQPQQLTTDEIVELSIWIEAPSRHIPTSVVGTAGRVVRIDSNLRGAVAVEFTRPGDVAAAPFEFGPIARQLASS